MPSAPGPQSHKRWRPRAGVRWLRLDEGLMVLVPDPITFVELDEPSAVLMELLVELDWERAAAVEALVADLQLSIEEAANTIDRLIDNLRHERIVAADP